MMKATIQNGLSKKYSSGTIIIHWLTAFLILTLFPLGKYMAGHEPAAKMGMIKIHTILGIVIFVLTIIRSWLFFKTDRPAALRTGSKFNDRLANWVHGAFYFLLFAIAISGMATMFIGGYGDALINGNAALIENRNDIPPLQGHGIMALLLMGLLLMHVIGVAKHYLTTKENTLKRIF